MTTVYIVYLRENAYEPQDSIDSVWPTEELAENRADEIENLKPKPMHSGYLPDIFEAEVGTIINTLIEETME